MYERFYGMRAKPFALTPDPSYLYPSRQHTMALTMLQYGLEAQAPLLLLTGEIGSGKTTLVRRLLRDLGERARVALITNTHSRFNSIHPWVLMSLGESAEGTSEVEIHHQLLSVCQREFARGRRTLIIIDEAQNLSTELLEELRLLSNMNVDGDLILQILLVGQPELRATLAGKRLRQLAQRVAVDLHLRPLTCEETHAYVQHRLRVAEADPGLIEPDAISMIYERTGGIPRLINQLCDHALVYGYAEQRRLIDKPLVSDLIGERIFPGALPTFETQGQHSAVLAKRRNPRKSERPTTIP